MTTSQQENTENVDQSAPDIDVMQEEHRSLDEKVNHLSGKSHLTADEDLELHRLKKEKLRLKDKIEAVMQHKESA